jgi:hypothetical protein
VPRRRWGQNTTTTTASPAMSRALTTDHPTLKRG